MLSPDRETQDAVCESMHAARVQTTYYPALTQLSIYEDQEAEGALPIAAEFADRHFAFPLPPSLDEAKISTVMEALESALAPR